MALSICVNEKQPHFFSMKIAEGGPPGRYARGRYAMRIRDFCLVLAKFSGGSLALRFKYVPPYLRT
jgi:hypothetical protein